MTDPKLTPREPTPEMVDAGFGYCVLPSDVWRAMHDAAPTVEADATPELLKAVRSVIAWYEAEDDHSKADFYKRLEMCRESETLCRAAIAKAEGHPAAPHPAALPELSDAEILALATNEFPYWREDIQAAFVLQLARAVIAALKGKQ